MTILSSISYIDVVTFLTADSQGQGYWEGGTGWGRGVPYGNQYVNSIAIQLIEYICNVNFRPQLSLYGK